MNARLRHKLLMAHGIRPGADEELDAMERAGWLRRVLSFHPRHYGGKKPTRRSELVEVFTRTVQGESVLAGEEPEA